MTLFFIVIVIITHGNAENVTIFHNGKAIESGQVKFNRIKGRGKRKESVKSITSDSGCRVFTDW